MEGRKKIILKKVIICARGFAVAGATNKAGPVGQCAPEKRLKRDGEALRSERRPSEDDGAERVHKKKSYFLKQVKMSIERGFCDKEKK